LSLIGDLELSSRHAATTNIESLTHAVLYVLPYPLIESKYLENAAFLRLVIDHLSFKLHSFSKMAAINLTYPVATRFAGYLTSTVLAPANNEELFTEDLHEVADMLGTTYRHLGRVIADMAAEELLTRQRGRLRILDAEGIRRLAGENLYE
jgi:CRP-like cAMP-binding protein